MSRMFQVVGLMVALAVSGSAADMVSIRMCADKDYDALKHECAAGKALEGSGIVIAPEGKAMNVLITGSSRLAKIITSPRCANHLSARSRSW